MFFDIALRYDAARGCCDMVFDGTDLVVDRTALTPMLIALGTDRRARPDDEIPNPDTDRLNPFTLQGRRGWAGDALDGLGRLFGSRLWLLVREKQSEAVRQKAENIVAEAMARFEARFGQAVQITVRWIDRGRLGIKVQVGATQLQLQRLVGA
jgi:phage gp46-like protein